MRNLCFFFITVACLPAWSQDVFQEVQHRQHLISEGLAAAPWRMVDGRIVHVDARWVKFSGTISQVLSNGVIINGLFDGSQGERDLTFDLSDYFVENFPYSVVEGDKIGLSRVDFALHSGTFEYVTVLGASRTIVKLDFGISCLPPAPTAGEIAAAREAARIAREKAAARKAIDEVRLLAWEEQEATNGNAAQQYNLGVRYLTGDGVAKDPRQARVWFVKAATQGDPDAIAALTNSPAADAAP